jgi:hypothetical protein
VAWIALGWVVLLLWAGLVVASGGIWLNLAGAAPSTALDGLGPGLTEVGLPGR